MNEYLKAQGYLSIGSRLRALSDGLFKQGNSIYKKYCPEMNGRWFPILRLLFESETPLTIMAIAEQVGFTHPYVIAQSKKMITQGFVQDERDKDDERRRLLSLTEKGKNLVEQVKPMWDCFEAVAKCTVENSGGDFLDALDRFEQELALRPWDSEADKYMQARDNSEVEVIEYEPRYKKDFARLNIQWLEKLFAVEDVDRAYFDDPQKKILNKCGVILFARYHGKIVGTCALFNEGEGVYELAKMGVEESVRGKGVGHKLMQACIAKFKELSGQQLYLETSKKLQPAIRLYKRHNFVDQNMRKPGSVYERSEVYMIWDGD